MTVGLDYPIALLLPEQARRDESAWALPISIHRAPTTKAPARVAAEQAVATLDDPELAWYE